MIKQAYINGFMHKCAEHGVDGRELLQKQARDWSWITDAVSHAGKKIKGLFAGNDGLPSRPIDKGRASYPQRSSIETVPVGWDAKSRLARHGTDVVVTDPWIPGVDRPFGTAVDAANNYMENVYGPLTDAFRRNVDDIVEVGGRVSPGHRANLLRNVGNSFRDARDAFLSGRFGLARGGYGWGGGKTDITWQDLLDPSTKLSPELRQEIAKAVEDASSRGFVR